MGAWQRALNPGDPLKPSAPNIPLLGHGLIGHELLSRGDLGRGLLQRARGLVHLQHLVFERALQRLQQRGARHIRLPTPAGALAAGAVEVVLQLANQPWRSKSWRSSRT